MTPAPKFLRALALPIVCGIFFLSGASALVLEIAWTRQLELLLGNSVFAASTMIAVYMLGLGLGAQLGARLARRPFAPLRIYAALEGMLILWALGAPLLLKWINLLFPLLAAIPGLHSASGTPALLRLLASVALFGVPTLLMGATLPVLTHSIATRAAGFATRFSFLYGTNTLGAVAGCLSAGFVLLPNIGISRTVLAALCLNVAAAIAALALARTAAFAKIAPASGAPNPAGDSPEAAPPVPLRLMTVLAGAAGFLALALEVLWFRTLVLIFGSTTYSLSAMLSIFLAATALGPIFLGWLGDRRGVGERIAFAAGVCFFGAGVAIAFSLNTIGGMPDRLIERLAESEFSWEALLASKFSISAQIILVPALFLSAVLPLCAKAFRCASGSAAAAARVYLANTAGATLGVLAAGFVVLPYIGLHTGLMGAAVASVVLGIACAFLGPGWPRLRPILPVLAIFIGLIWLTFNEPWDLKKFALGAYFHPDTHSEAGRVRFDEVLETSTLAVYREGIATTVAVLKSHDGTLRYTSNGKVEADSGTRSMINQRLLGHLPMLLHPGEPKTVLNIGLGAGVTLGALAQHPEVEDLHIVEIEPAATVVADAFAAYNQDVLQHPKLKVYFNDARNLLLTTRTRYDVISSDPFEPVAAGAIHLFTREHFELARGRLAPGGILCQWLPMYELSLEDYSTLVGTFLSVFPQTLYFSTGADSILIGFADRVRIDSAKAAARLREPAVATSLAEIGFTKPEHFWGMLIADLSATPPAPPVRPNTDDDPFIEFTAPRVVLEATEMNNRRHQLDLFDLGRSAGAIPVLERSFAGPELEAITRHRAAIETALRAGYEWSTGASSEALESAAAAYAAAPDNPLVLHEVSAVYHGAGSALLRQGDHVQALPLLRRAYEYQPREFRNLYRLCLALLRRGESDAAEGLLAAGMQQFPDSPFFFSLQGSLNAEAGQYKQALAFHKAAVEKAPRLDHLWEQYERSALIAGDDEALEEIRQARRRHTEE